MIKNEMFKEIKRDILNDMYSLVDSEEVEENIYLTLNNEGNKTIVFFEDLRNNENGGFVLNNKEILKMNCNEFNNTLNSIYFYNCNNPM